MARPTEEGLKYFTHDTDASTDEKIEILRMLYGNDGYAFYFILLERIYRSNNAELNVSEAEICQILAKNLMLDEQKFSEILQKSIKIGLFDRDAYNQRKVLTSNGIKHRASIVLKKREAMKERYKEQKNEQNFGDVSDAETPLSAPQSIVKESIVNKVKDSKEKERIESISSNNHQEIDDIFNFWNEQKIIVHGKETDKMKMRIRKSLKDNDVDSIKKAIGNYGEVMRHPELYFFSYKWALEDFVSSGLTKFLDNAEPLKNYLKDKSKTTTRQPLKSGEDLAKDNEEFFNQQRGVENV
jgi:Domain of unknown function (DUF4373)